MTIVWWANVLKAVTSMGTNNESGINIWEANLNITFRDFKITASNTWIKMSATTEDSGNPRRHKI